MAKKKKRVDLKKNRSKPARDKGWTRGFQQHGYAEEATVTGERVRAKGDLSRKRTIIQEDQADWLVEAPRMGLVYANAVCTISATASETPSGGCFKPKKPFQNSPKSSATIDLQHGATSRVKLWWLIVLKITKILTYSLSLKKDGSDLFP